MRNRSFRIRALSAALAADIRRTRRDAYGNVLQTRDAEGGEPCRVCLRDARAGEPLLLFSYASVPAPRPYHNVGPIFIHAEACPAYEDGGGATPEQLTRRLLSLHVHDADGEMVTADVVAGAELDATVEQMFARADAAYILVHNARPGCFACRIERARPELRPEL